MPSVFICFADGEVLGAETPEITFDLPVVEAEIRGADHNSEIAILPVTAIRQIIIAETEKGDTTNIAEWDKAAFHFTDGQVLRASVAPDFFLGSHGGIWTIAESGSQDVKKLAIPYAALKGVFRIRQWDSRPLGERDSDVDPMEQLAKILAERETGQPHKPRRRPLLARVRRK